ncbi:rod shape-determining protein MreC [Microbispora sp. RL4-1S]|uniref:Cell shape-determining protein MreC n=1 Tax=Microbispora oryzae TaxID=2806554 RepID=A0A941AIF0_9ACTN|nr:rod shape-determining protein MreC [Microbispora oryzae]MBP2705130.1 rod shape-determining protein MreC [Microbispora oryzae]
MRSAGRRVPVLLVLLSLLLVAADRWWPLTPLRSFGSVVYGPIEDASSAVARWASGGGARERLEAENARLRGELLAARRNAAAPVTGPATGTATGPGPTAGLAGYRVVAAHAIGFGSDQTVTLDVGTGAGVAGDMTVVDRDGLVGRVVRAGPTTSTVRLPTAASASVGARLEGSREVGLVTGVPEKGLLRLSLLNSDAAVRAGDRVVTLGSQGMRPYVPDVPVGVVIKVEGTPGALTRTALVRPFARFTALDLVTVVLSGPDPLPGGEEGPG